MAVLDPSLFKVGQEIVGVASLTEKMTLPPRNFEEGDLVDIMDNIGRYADIGRDDLAVLKTRNAAGSGNAGIGTSRTRGEIIKKTFESGFIEKFEKKEQRSKKKYIRPTAKAVMMYDFLIDKRVSKVLVSPEMTAKWEIGLKKVEMGEITEEQFMSKIVEMVSAMTSELLEGYVRPTKEKIDKHPMDGNECPKCKKGSLLTRFVSKKESKNFGKRFVACGKCDYFGEFID